MLAPLIFSFPPPKVLAERRVLSQEVLARGVWGHCLAFFVYKLYSSDTSVWMGPCLLWVSCSGDVDESPTPQLG